MLDYYETKLNERKQKWWEWHKENPQVWEKFKEYTFDAIASGRRHYSHWAIVNRIRWNKEIETSGEDFKISNDYISFYARLFHAKYPEHDGFFKLKPLKEEKEIEKLKEFGYNQETRLFG
jgi:hypothetical protein|tara:strand:+ start:660 stop:1019 length:360 start_codon:yes stop_codon:yes gene_type:complete